MSPPMRQSVARISEELGIHVVTLYGWRKAWRLQGEVVQRLNSCLGPAWPAPPYTADQWQTLRVVMELAGN